MSKEGMMDCDVLIVGAGPGGATLARLLPSTLSVIVIEKDSPGKVKCCGGLLAPDAQRVLAEMNLALPGDVLDGAQPFAVRVIDIDNDLERKYQRFYVNVDRGRFDSFLQSLIPSSAPILYNHRFKNATREKDAWIAEIQTSDQVMYCHARIIVGADGALSRVRSALCRHAPELKKYPSAQRFFKRVQDEAYFTAVFDRRLSDYYHWLIPKKDHCILGVTAEEGGDARAGLALLQSELENHSYRFGEQIGEQGTVIRRPMGKQGLFVGKKDIFLLGEAAGFISPSSAEGISYALRSARAMAKAMKDGLDEAGQRYARLSAPLAQNILRKTLKCPVMYWPKMRALALQSKMLTI